jgi:RNA polymerase sigma factor (sigma-70 family)
MNTPGNQDLQQHRPYLLRYAMLQLRDRELAEDVVQETLLAVLEGRAGFSGNSSHKTWLTGILKHKIIDMMRRKSREQPLTSTPLSRRRQRALIEAPASAACGHRPPPPAPQHQAVALTCPPSGPAR